MNKKLILTLALLLTISTSIAQDVNVTVNVRTQNPIVRALSDIGSGVGGFFAGLSVPILIFLILISIGGVVGTIFSKIGSGETLK